MYWIPNVYSNWSAPEYVTEYNTTVTNIQALGYSRTQQTLVMVYENWATGASTLVDLQPTAHGLVLSDPLQVRCRCAARACWRC